MIQPLDDTSRQTILDMAEVMGEENMLLRQQIQELTDHTNKLMQYTSILKARQAHYAWKRAQFESLKERVVEMMNDISETPNLGGK